MIVPSRHTVLENICQALIAEGITATREGDLIEMKSDELGCASLELLEDYSEVSLTADINLLTPKDEAARHKLLNGLNRWSGPVRFFQTCHEEVIHARAQYMLLGTSLSQVGLSQLIKRFHEEFEYAETVLLEEDYLGDAFAAADKAMRDAGIISVGSLN